MPLRSQHWLECLRRSLFRGDNRRRRRDRRRFPCERLEDRTLLAAPYSANDNYSAVAGQTLTVNAAGVLANDYDPDGSPLSAQLMSMPSIGSVTLNSNGGFTFQSPSGYSGYSTFSYRAFDGIETGNTATVTISIASGGTGPGSPPPAGSGGGSNQPPVIVADSFYAEQNSSGAKLPVLWNDSDPDNNPLTVTSVSNVQTGTASPSYDMYSGRYVVSYSPPSGCTGASSLNYTVSDGTASGTAPVSLTIHPTDNTIAQARPLSLQSNVRHSTGGIIGDGPQSWSDVDLYSVSLNAGELIRLDVDSAKTDAGGSFGSLNSLLRLFNSSGTQVAANDNAVDPDTGISSNDAYLVYTATTSGVYYIGVSDASNTSYNPNTSGGGYSASSGAYSLQILKEVPNAPPVAVADAAITHHGTVVDVPVLANDSDPNGDSLTISQTGSASHGTVSVITVAGTQQIRYAPVAGYVGSDSFSYTISDPMGATATGSVSLTVTNTSPVASSETYEAVAGQIRSVDAGSGLLANDTDENGDPLTAVLVSGVAHGTLTLNTDGSFSYLATSGYLGTDSFVYRVSDGVGFSANATVTLSVFPTNVTAFGESYSTGHDRTLSVATPGVLTNDWDFEHQTVTAVLVTTTSHGALAFNVDGSFVYVPTAGFVGSDSFVYKATDGTNESAAITVPISVTNFAPWSVNDYYTIGHDRVLSRSATTGLLANDVDVEGDTLTVTLVTGPASGALVLNADGSFDYTPVTGATGTESFTYKISDGFNFSQNATATLSIVNSTPSPSSDLLSTPSGQSLAISLSTLLSNDVDTDGDAVTLSVSASGSSGIFVGACRID